MLVTVYLTETSVYCKKLKDYLVGKNIPFTEKNVDTEEAVREEMKKDSGGFLGVPFTVVVKDDGSKETIIGFDKGRIDQILQINQ